MKLDDRSPIFIGCKLDGPLRRELRSVSGPDRKYISGDSGFLSIVRLGDDEFVGRIIRERLTTERVDDIRRNVLSILQRLCPEIRLPRELRIVACESSDESSPDPS